jgi:hypothetical protein
MWFSNMEKKKDSCLNISSTNIDTLVSSLYHCFKTRSIEVFWLLSQPLSHLRFKFFVTSETFATKLEPLYATNTSHHKQETFIYEYPLQWALLPTEQRTTERCSSVVHFTRSVAILTTETSLLKSACASAIWTVMMLKLYCYLVIHIN